MPNPTSMTRSSAVVLALILAVAGCAHTVSRPLGGDLTKRGAIIFSSPGERISGFTTVDRLPHRFKGYARLVADTLQFWSKPRIGTYDEATGTWTDSLIFAGARPRAEVITLERRRFSLGETSLLLGGTLVVAIIVAAVAYNSAGGGTGSFGP